MTWQELKTRYSIGEIYNLQVVNILTGPQLILFKIEGFDCRLHISNIANEPELSNKLFSVIKIGDVISVVITDFYDEKQNINLSTKVFRTHLDDVLPFTKSKQIIEEEQSEHLSLPGRYLSMHRNMLDRLRGDLSSNELTFLYELIQNAVDHPNRKNFNNVSVKFEIFNNYLLVKHNGSLFTENNFKSITGILAGELINENDRERIGYKGIGFKSVFRYSHNVYIRSGNFSFSFNKNISGSEMPWEVLPIFQFEKNKVEEIQQFDFFNVPVAFAIELVNKELKNDVIKYLKQLSQNPYLLVFLENLIRLEILIPDENYRLEKEIESQDNFDILTLKSNSVEEGKFLTYSKEYEITNPEVVEELLDDNITAIPSKMRNFRKPKVSIALPINDKLGLINLFTYLPLSNTTHGLPYIINADFIPDLDRTDLVHNLKYNSEVLKFASQALLSFSQLLINEAKYSDFLKLIPDFENSNISTLGIIAKNYFENADALELPNIHNTKTKKENLVIDKTGIFKIIDEKLINEIEKFRNKQILSSAIDDQENKLENHLDLDVFGENDLVELFNLESFKKSHFLNYRQLINFLFKIRNLENSKKIYKLIKDKVKPFLLDNGYYSIGELTAFVPEQFKETFKLLDIYIPIPSELEVVIEKRLNIKSLFDLLSIKEYDNEYTVDKIAKNIKEITINLFINESENINVITRKKLILNKLWFFLFSNKDISDNRNNAFVNNRFSELLIECNNGQLILLKDSLLKKEDKSREDYSFLYERYGDKEINYINIDTICSEYNIKQVDFSNFIKQIADVEITESKLFNQTLKKLSNNDYNEIYASNSDDVIRSLISVFHYLIKVKNLDLNRDNLYEFPIVCNNDKIIKPYFLYFEKSYARYIQNIDFYADQLFDGVENINFISSKYLEKIEEKSKNDFFNFLVKLKISSGIKIFIENEKNNLIRHKIFNYTFLSNDKYYGVNYFSKLDNKRSNLLLFWDKLTKEENYKLLLNKIKPTSKNPIDSYFIQYLNNKNLKYFPLKNGKCVTANEVYSPDLEIYLKDNKNSLTFDINEFNGLKECLNFKNKLDNEDIIKALLSNKDYQNKDYHKLIIDHFNNSDFTSEQTKIIIESIEFKCMDDEFRKIGETVYLDKSLELLPISLISKSNDLFKISIDNLDYNEEFKNKLTKLGITVIEDINLTINHTKEKIESDSIIEEIQNIVDEYFNDKIIAHDISEIEYFFNTYDFIHCSNIEISFDNYTSYSEPVLFYNDQNNKQLFFSDGLILLDVLCEEFGINNADKIIIRKKLNKLKLNKNRENEDSVNENNLNEYNNSNEFSLTEIETLKKIIGGELTEELTSQKEANFSASLKGILHLDNIGFSPTNPEEFRKTNIKSFQNEENEERKIIFRSAVKGLLYLDPYSWKQLETGMVELWIYQGHDNFIIIYSKLQLLNLPYNPYTLIRIDNLNKDVGLVNTLMENAPITSTKLLFITNQEIAEKLNTDIFNNENNQITKNSVISDENYL